MPNALVRRASSLLEPSSRRCKPSTGETVLQAASSWALFIALLLVNESVLAQADSWVLREGQHAQSVVTGDGGRKIHLLLFLPKGYADRKWPLMVFLHSGIAGGSD